MYSEYRILYEIFEKTKKTCKELGIHSLSAEQLCDIIAEKELGAMLVLDMDSEIISGEEPMENDMLLFQTGIYDYTDEPLFYFDLVRQYPNEDEEFYQIHVELSYKPSSENQKCNESIWNEEIDGDFFEYIRNSESYKCASADSYEKINIYLDET